MVNESPTHLALSPFIRSQNSLPPSSTEKHEVQSIPELGNLFSRELDLNGFSRPERTRQVFSDTSSCGDEFLNLAAHLRVHPARFQTLKSCSIH